MNDIKTYSELILLDDFYERFAYLNLNGKTCEETFGVKRYLNQVFYRSKEWKKVRRDVLIRDNACDLGIPDMEIYGNAIIHHINPITEEDIKRNSYILLDPENLITVSFDTHNAIHYGNKDSLIFLPIERNKNDTCPWRK